MIAREGRGTGRMFENVLDHVPRIGRFYGRNGRTETLAEMTSQKNSFHVKE